MIDGRIAPCWGLDDEGNPVSVSWEEWAVIFADTPRRIVRRDTVGRYLVSTVFLGIDHGFGLSDRPILFETMIFGGDFENDYQERYFTFMEALDGHEAAIVFARGLA